jgi:predicted enzyme related to lactoylglutathione lyase
MKAEVSRIILFVDDIDAMSAFYGGVLGLDKLPGGDAGFVCFAGGGCEICLHSLPQQYRSDGSVYPKREDTYVKFVFRSDDVERDRKYLVENGLRMSEIVRYGEIDLCDGADPEGNIFQISSR